MDRLIFTLGEDLFGIDVRAVARIVEKGKVFHLPLAPPSIIGAINFKGDLIPAINPAYVLNIHSLEPLLEPIERAFALILGTPPRFVGLPLNEAVKVYFVCEERLSDIPLRKIKGDYIKGVTMYKQDEVKILDWERILQDVYELPE